MKSAEVMPQVSSLEGRIVAAWDLSCIVGLEWYCASNIFITCIYYANAKDIERDERETLFASFIRQAKWTLGHRWRFYATQLLRHSDWTEMSAVWIGFVSKVMGIYLVTPLACSVSSVRTRRSYFSSGYQASFSLFTTHLHDTYC